MTDVVVQREALRKEAIAQAAAQGDAEEVEASTTGFFTAASDSAKDAAALASAGDELMS